MILRWGILGVARINRSLIPPLQSSERNQLVAIASRDARRAEEAATRWRIPRSYGTYEELLADPEIDVVYNPLPNDLHVEWSIRAARAGKHVLCEKPLALTSPDLARLEDASRAKGVVVAEAFMYRHHPQTLKVRELVMGGVLGPVGLVRGSFTFTLNNPQDYRADPKRGGGALWDIGCYPVSYARYVLGEEPTLALGSQTLGGTGIDETFVGVLRFPGGALLSFDCGFSAPYRTQMEIVGREASLVVPRPFKPGLEEKALLIRDGRDPEELPMPGDDLYRGEVEDMADAVLLRKPPRVGLQESRGNLLALAALRRAAETGLPAAIGAPSAG